MNKYEKFIYIQEEDFKCPTFDWFNTFEMESQIILKNDNQHDQHADDLVIHGDHMHNPSSMIINNEQGLVNVDASSTTNMVMSQHDHDDSFTLLTPSPSPPPTPPSPPPTPPPTQMPSRRPTTPTPHATYSDSPFQFVPCRRSLLERYLSQYMDTFHFIKK